MVVETRILRGRLVTLDLSLFLFSLQCSVSCGSGIMKRAVKCLARNRTYLDDSHCTTPSSSKPDPARSCHMKACKYRKHSSCVGTQCIQTPNVKIAMPKYLRTKYNRRRSVGLPREYCPDTLPVSQNA